MGDSVLQNLQRAVIVVQFGLLFITTLLLTIKIMKKRIDITPMRQLDSEASQQAAKYKPQSRMQISLHPFDIKNKTDNVFKQQDTCVQRMIKKCCQFNTQFKPLMILLVLNFVMGQTYAFCLWIYFTSLALCWVFNTFKIHRVCIQHMLSRMLIQILWIMVLVLLMVNSIVQVPSSMLYNLKEG